MPKQSILRHIVMYSFKESTTDAEVEEVVKAFCALPGRIPEVIGFEHGINSSPEGKSEGFTHCFLVSFRDANARDVYIAHPAHQEFVNLVKERREKVIVLDYLIDAN